MSPQRTPSYSDLIEVRTPAAGSPQRGLSSASQLVLRDLTDAEKRAAGLFATSVAIRQGWVDGLAEMVDMLGIAK